MAVTLVSQAEYARRRGVTPGAVKKAVDTGRITIVERDGKPMLDPEVADIQWEKNTNANMRRTGHAIPDFSQDSLAPGEGEAAAVPAYVASLYDAQAARAKREYHEANLAAMREAKEAGSLVERAAVIKLATDAGATLRSSLERLPGLALELAAVTDANVIQAMLHTKIAEILSDAVDNLRRLAGSVDEGDDGRLDS